MTGRESGCNLRAGETLVWSPIVSPLPRWPKVAMWLCLTSLCFGMICAAAAAATPGTTRPSNAFQAVWDRDFLHPVPAGASYETIPGGLSAGRLGLDVNYEIAAADSDPVVDVVRAGSWGIRRTGTSVAAKTHLPFSWVLPDADFQNPVGPDCLDTQRGPNEQPNNPVIILNGSHRQPVFLNGAARPTMGGPIYGFVVLGTHGGSRLIGGELTLVELATDSINHALAINIWGRKYLSRTGRGFVAPARNKDFGFDDPKDANYYNGTIDDLKMGSRLALDATVTTADLKITSPTAMALFHALKAYGVFIVDNSAWDCLYINATPDTVAPLNACQPEIRRLLNALEIVH